MRVRLVDRLKRQSAFTRLPGRSLPPRRRKFLPTTFGSFGSLEVRLANSRTDVRLAQRLRYQVFFEEMSAVPSITARLRRRDEDAFDAICDHFLVVDNSPAVFHGQNSLAQSSSKPLVVGTYRVLRGEVARQCQQPFYSESEYDIASLLCSQGLKTSCMELGRSCVLKPYRNRRTVELLWHGLWTYVRRHKINILFGCASFPGTDPGEHAMALSFLHYKCRAPVDLAAKALEHLYQPMNLVAEQDIDVKAAMRAMPPLIKAYLRLGAFIGDGAVVDPAFGTTDVLIVLPVERIDPRYFTRFGSPQETIASISTRAGGRQR